MPEYRVVCDCRKPRPGLLLQAAGELGLDLQASVMVGDSLTDIVIPSGVQTLNAYTFRHCDGLASVQLPEGLTTIRESCFWNCSSLSSVNFPSSLQTIGNGSFINCALTRVELPASIMKLSNYAFSYCNALTEAIVPSGTLYNGVFSNCTALQRLVLGDGVSSISVSPVVGDTALTDLTVTEGNATFCARDNILYNHDVTTLVAISPTVSGDLVLSETLTSLKAFGLLSCPSLTSITFPAGFTTVGSSSFSSCASLKRLVFKGACPTIGSDCNFSGMTAYYPLKLADSWASFTSASTQAYINVTWERGDGTASVVTLENVTDGHIAKPADPVRNGYTFDGWFDGATEDAAPWDFAAGTVSDDIALYARWTANAYTITFDTLGGSEVASIYADCDAPVTAPADPTRDGYLFTGWEPAFPATMPAGGLTLTAKWLGNNYTITFDANGGSAVDPLTAACGSALTAPADPARNGYTFTGWNPAFPSEMPLGGVALTAQWTANLYTIAFVTDGGTEIAPIEANCDAPVAPPANPTRTSYTFSGWAPAFPATMPAGGLTLTAQWKPKPVEKIALSTENGYAIVYKGELVQLLTAFTPEDAYNQTLLWKSSSATVASVSATGVVKGKNSGTVKIAASATDGSKKSAYIVLRVALPDTSLKLNASSAILYCNGATSAQKTLQLKATALPGGTVYRGLTYTVVSGEDAATVDAATGLVTAVRDGTAVIRATTERGSMAECTVTVRTLPTAFTLNTAAKTLAFAQTFDLAAEVVLDGSEPALTFRSSNTAVATVTAAGVVKASAYRTGTATITVATKNGLKAICIITVVKVLPVGASHMAQADVMADAPPAGLMPVGLRLAGEGYATDNASVADIDTNGTVTLTGDGAATLAAGGLTYGMQVADGNLSALTLCANVQLMLVSEDALVWTVADDNVAVIDAGGLLAATGAGVTVVNGMAADGRSIAIAVTVVAPVTETPQPTQTALPESAAAEPEITPSPSDTPTCTAEMTQTPEPTPMPSPEPTPEPPPEPTPEPTPVPTAVPAPELEPDAPSA